MQISKLRAQLNELNETNGETECTNGMLREEVLYLEVSSFGSYLIVTINLFINANIKSQA